MHQDEHKGIKRFSCQFCDRKFQCHGNKLKHERRHIGEKKHKCQLCDKGKSLSSRSLARYVENHDLTYHLASTSSLHRKARAQEPSKSPQEEVSRASFTIN